MVFVDEHIKISTIKAKKLLLVSCVGPSKFERGNQQRLVRDRHVWCYVPLDGPRELLGINLWVLNSRCLIDFVSERTVLKTRSKTHSSTRSQHFQ